MQILLSLSYIHQFIEHQQSYKFLIFQFQILYNNVQQDRNLKIEESNQLKTVITELELNKTDLNRQKEQLDKEIEDIKQQFHNQKEENEQKMNFLEEETQKKDKEIEKFRLELEVIKKEKEHQVASLKEELIESEKKLLQIQSELQSTQEQFNQLQHSTNASKSEAHILYQELLKEYSQMDSINRQHSKQQVHQNELNQLIQQINESNLQIKRYQTQIQSLSTNIQQHTMVQNQQNHQNIQYYIQEQIQIILLESIIQNISKEANTYKQKSEMQFKENQQSILDLNSSLDQLSTNCLNFQKLNNELDQELIRIQKISKEDVNTIQQLKNQLTSKDQQISQIQIQYQEFEQQQNKSLQDLEDLKILFEQIQKEKLQLEIHLAEQYQLVKDAHIQQDLDLKELSERKLEILKLKDEISKIFAKDQNQNLETQSLKQLIEQLSEEKLYLQELTKTFEETIQRKDEEIEEVNKNLQELRQTLTLKTYEIEQLEQDFKQSKEDLALCQQKLFDEQNFRVSQDTQFKIQLENYIRSQNKNSDVLDFSENKIELLEQLQGQKIEFDVNIQTQNEKLRIFEQQNKELRNEQFKYLEKINELSEIINSDSVFKDMQKNFIQEILVNLIKQSDGLKQINQQESENQIQDDYDDLDKLKTSIMMQINILNGQIEQTMNNLKEIQLKFVQSTEQINKLEQELKESQENQTKNKLLIESLILNISGLNEQIEGYQKSSSINLNEITKQQESEKDLLKKDYQNKINRIQEALHRREQDFNAMNDQYNLMLQDQVNKTEELNNLRKKYDDFMSDIDRMTPTRSPSNSISQKPNQIDQYQQYFILTAQAVALSSDDPMAAAEIKLKNFYQEAKSRNLPFHQWHIWLQLKLKEELSKNKKR